MSIDRGATSTLALFDIDGTLTQTTDIDASCFANAAKGLFPDIKFSNDWTTYSEVTDAGIAAEVFRQRLGRNPTVRELGKFEDRFVKCLEAWIVKRPQVCQAVAGAVALIDTLKESDLPIAIGTGGWLRSARLKLSTAGIPCDDIPLSTSTDSPVRTEIMSLAVQRAANRTSFDRVILIGDGLWDLNTANSLGYGFIGIDTEHDGVLRNAGVEVVFTDFRDTPRFLRALSQPFLTYAVSAVSSMPWWGLLRV